MSRRKLYEGKGKILYEGPDPGTIIQHFKDDATAFNGKKHAVIQGKGVLNNRISEFIFVCLEEIGIPTHFIKTLNMREQLVKACEIIPVEMVIRNVTAGSMSERFGVEEGMLLPRPLIEFYLKSDKLNDPMITEEHVLSFDWALVEELDEMKRVALRVNDFLSGLFLAAGIKLVDMKLEFGRVYDEEGNLYILLADEISPDCCRLWDIETGEKLDKDRFRRDLGSLEEGYREVARRLGVLEDNVTEESAFLKKLEERRNQPTAPQSEKAEAAKKKGVKKPAGKASPGKKPEKE